jgi:hypothetical protein
MSHSFQLLLFSTDLAYVRAAVAAGIDGVIVDWEHIGKLARQTDADTQVNLHTDDDLREVRAATDAHIICRINNVASVIEDEVERAIRLGADEILLPMVETPAEVTQLLSLVGGRAVVSIMVETEAAVRHAAELGRLPLGRVYVGLNDLAIQRRSANIFENVLNGTVEATRAHFPHTPFGFAGITLPTKGSPIPCWLLIAEMMRLDTHFTFLRRSFMRDVPVEDVGWALPAIREALEQARQRPHAQIAADQAALHAQIAALLPHSR